jgi:hypothetical protein
VASASGRRQSSGRKTKPPASLSWIENTKSIDADRRTYFFNSIDPSRPERRHEIMSEIDG